MPNSSNGNNNNNNNALNVQVGHEVEDSKPSAKKAKIRGEPFNNNADGNEMPGATNTTE